MDIFAIPDECQNDDVVDPNKSNQKDTIVQLTISLALGLSCFIAFCVSHLLFQTGPMKKVLITSDLETEVEKLICCAEAAGRCCRRFARVARHLRWMDTSFISSH
jgi:hypothetical protein